jgi:serine/threonine-protein kinase
MTAYRLLHHPDDLLVDTTIDRWRVVERIASSDHATVFRARGDDRDVALKLCRTAGDPDAVKRIEREAEALRRVKHRAVAQLLTAGMHRDTPYVVTLWIEGTLLAERLAPGPIAWPELYPLLVAIGDGLAAIHRANIVHRDVKPTNIVLPAHGEPAAVLLDLGHAIVLGDPRITPSSVAIGTDDFMAPEQIAGATPDVRWDLYALGVIVYRALTGTPPFAGAGAKLWRAQATAAIEPPRRRAPERSIPREAEDLCLWLLAHAPHQRLPSSHVLGVTLRALSPRGRSA